MSLIYRGSVKDIYQLGAHLQFIYSDRYSIFDWGEMPDQIPHKGEALAFMAASFFEYLKTKNIQSHYVGFNSKNSIEVKPVRILRPTWDSGEYNYQIYKDRPTDCLVPLEVIFRYRLGLGNSLEKRLKKNPAYLKDLGLTAIPDAQVEFKPALVEFSTKLESSDRYLDQNELAALKVVSAVEQKNIKILTQNIADELKNLFATFGVQLWDGKVEFGFSKQGTNGEREMFLVDSIGPDELRLTSEGLPLSKEFLRQIYTNSTWAANVARAKEIAQQRSEKDWKKICTDELKSSPEKLTPSQLETASNLYLALANELARSLNKKLPFDSRHNLTTWNTEAKKVLKDVGL